MPKKGESKKQRVSEQIIGPLGDPGSLYFQMKQFLQYQRERSYSERTVGNREHLLIAFIRWCDERGLTRPQEITRPILERYQRHLFLYRKADGEALSARSQTVRITPIRVWFKWLTKTNRILYNPASDLDLPRMEQRLPKHILSSDEAERILNVPDTQTPTGIRDRAMLETLYSTGMRRMELISLSWSAIDYERGTVMIRQGKGKKDRMIPIGERALAWITKYRDDVRPQFALAQDDGTLFLTQQGEVFSPNRLSQLVREHIDKANIGKGGSCHLFRHTMATLMLENGADIRFIQAMLGHVSLNTTQIYTQVSIRALKEIHTATHPARLQRQHSASETTTETLPDDPVEALLTALDAEADEESELA
ncbi:site-specific tyrosine recombinase XerC [Pseudomonas sp. 10B1]|uniref:site-specific tyrosine recombinase XerC n=1 Tax=unclassified Pseudomonas TaxID=196821 RepID=UPI002B224FB1|nr:MULTISPECIES: site-specific tyrosine recombinase XerC [unclassified Pseudomonas]MEA9997426.1 site-specific tyrosine recombinase XerC [Pseudomonas sp. AA4]MEB0089523.1 site-specific tyrosine recombinase XerC [Pseudomonas sp. RTI1]MEB0128597.1 site-specific tyrosine recombinase XerC [Pseudomonas sp. CCC1.2]MEB0155944.1 site-specific tyrosine recombinase XerC [Pseudomonas sp. CCC4.3]MEB0222237.1 site-specific tyrosine recombinase XerC [Pseudomonas sp. AB12(2023)]